jgi:hypothetical protein
VALALDLAYTKSEVVTVPVGEAGGQSWSLQFELQEDMPITLDERLPPYLAERPLTAADIAAIEGGRPATFDRQPLPRALTVSARPGRRRAALETGNGLHLSLAADGRVTGLSADGTDLAPADAPGFAGFLVRDLRPGGGLWPVTGTLTREGHTWRLAATSKELALHFGATLEPRTDHVAVTGELEDASGADRAISLYLLLPVRRDGLNWWDDIDRRCPVAPDREYGNWEPVNAGANGRHSVYPFASAGAVALGVPLDRPVLHRLGYNAATQRLFLCLDLALTQATTKFPGRAAFGAVLYPIAPEWGFRAAADRYYHIYPASFGKRTPDGGMLCALGPLTDPAERRQGFAYQWAAESPEAVIAATKLGLAPLLYNDSMRYFIFLGFPPDTTPTREQQAEDVAAFLSLPDPQRVYLDRPAVAARLKALDHWQGLTFDGFCTPAGAETMKRLHQAVARSAFHDPAGRIIPTYYCSAAEDLKAYGYNIHTARVLCNPDPDIAGGFGQWLLEEVIGGRMARFEAAGAGYAGVALDNYFVNATDADFRREHFAAADYPLTFAADLRPVWLGDFCLYEWTKALAERLRAKGGCLSANTCTMRFPFATAWLDVNLFEWNIESNQAIARTLACQRPVVTLPMQKHHYEDPWVRGNHLRFAFFPGGYAGTPASKPVMAVYDRYLPALQRLAAAGWEPLTYAAAEPAGVLVERFGAWTSRSLCFTLLNPTRADTRATVTLDCDALDLPRRALKTATVTDLVDAHRAVSLDASRRSFSLNLAAGEVVALRLAPATGTAPGSGTARPAGGDPGRTLTPPR